jgi:hypothetical protein
MVPWIIYMLENQVVKFAFQNMISYVNAFLIYYTARKIQGRKEARLAAFLYIFSFGIVY